MRTYANQARSRSDFRQRIFVDDAAEGFAFIDVLAKKYDVILMNPPFGGEDITMRLLLSGTLPLTCMDFYAMFYERSLSLINSRGKVGAISNRTWLGLPTFANLRTKVFGASGCIEVAADLGSFVLDAQVETVALVAGRDFLLISKLSGYDCLRRKQNNPNFYRRYMLCQKLIYQPSAF